MNSFLFPIKDQPASFVNGVEFGRLFAQFELQLEVINASGLPVHTENVELIRTACLMFNYVPTFLPVMIDSVIQPEWTHFRATRQSFSVN